MSSFWSGFEKRAVLNYIPGVKQFRRGYKIIDKAVGRGQMNAAGEIASHISKRKEVAGKAMAHGALKTIGTAALLHHVTKTKGPNAG